jgi:hypothetical protein
VAQPDLEVVGIVSRRHFHEAGTELGIDELVGDDRDLALGQRQENGLTEQSLVTLILGVDRYCGITQHRLGPRGRHHDIVRFVAHDGIALIVQRALDILVLYLLVSERGSAAGTPVDDVVTPVDEPLLVQAHEHLAHRAAESRVKGKSGTIPIRRTADRLQLVEDGAARLLHPRPDALDEFLAAQVPALDSLGGQSTLDDVLRGDPSVVGPRHPQRFPALHAAPADEHILNSVVQAVTHMQLGSHVGWRHDDDVRLPVAVLVGGEIAVLHPVGVRGLLE